MYEANLSIYKPRTGDIWALITKDPDTMWAFWIRNYEEGDTVNMTVRQTPWMTHNLYTAKGIREEIESWQS